MSVQTVNAFLQQARNDSRLGASLKGLTGDRDSAITQTVATASEAGFEFTAGEYEEAIRARFKDEHGARFLGPDEIEKLWGNRSRGEISEDGTCSWFECQGTGDNCGSDKTINSETQTGC